MKKHVLGILLAGAMGCALLTGCGQKTASQTEAADAQTTAAQATNAAQTTDSAQTASSITDLTGHTLMIYCGAGMTKPFQEISDCFQKESGCEMNVTYANAGQIQSQINTSKEGDLFIAGSAEELKPVQDFVAGSKDLVKHIPVLAVQSGNPKGISSLESLTGEGISLIVGDAEATPIGKIAKKALTDKGIFEQVHIEATTATAPQMAAVISSGEADAAIIWKENCDAEGVEIVENSGLEDYIKTIPAACLNCEGDPEAKDVFLEYLDSEDAKKIWMKYGYEIAE